MTEFNLFTVISQLSDSTHLLLTNCTRLSNYVHRSNNHNIKELIKEYKCI